MTYSIHCIIPLLTLPESVTKRWYYSFSVWNVSHNTLWVVQFEGYFWPDKFNDPTMIQLCKCLYCLFIIILLE